MDISEWLMSFFNRSTWVEKIVIIICGLFILLLVYIISKYGVASWNQ